MDHITFVKEDMVYKLDVIFSVGVACRPAYHLKSNGLRFFASPLDWMNRYSLDTVLHLFDTSFEDFFVDIEEDLEWKGSLYRKIHDIKNNICSLHHFRPNTVLSEEQ